MNPKLTMGENIGDLGAEVWRSLSREDALREQHLPDPHSPAQCRINGVVRNIR